MEDNSINGLLYNGWQNDPHDFEWYDSVFEGILFNGHYSSDLMKKVLECLKVDFPGDTDSPLDEWHLNLMEEDPELFLEIWDENKFTPEGCDFYGWPKKSCVVLCSGFYERGYYEEAAMIALELTDYKYNLKELGWNEERAINYGRAIIDGMTGNGDVAVNFSEGFGLDIVYNVWKEIFNNNTPSEWAANIINEYGCKLKYFFDESELDYEDLVSLCFQIASCKDDMEDAIVSHYYLKYGESAKFWRMIDRDDRISVKHPICEVVVFHSEHHEGKLIKRPDKKGGKSGKKGKSRRRGLPKALKFIYKAYKRIFK